MASKVIDIDRGFDELKRTLVSLKRKGAYVKVGVIGSKAAEIHPDEKGGTPLTNVDVAIIQEFGVPTKGIPSRPWIGGTFEENKAKYARQLAAGLKKVYANEMTVEKLLGLIGVEMTKDIKARVMTGHNFVPNAPSTVRKKKSDRPLVDTNRMVGSVTHQIVLDGGEE